MREKDKVPNIEVTIDSEAPKTLPGELKVEFDYLLQQVLNQWSESMAELLVNFHKTINEDKFKALRHLRDLEQAIHNIIDKLYPQSDDPVARALAFKHFMQIVRKILHGNVCGANGMPVLFGDELSEDDLIKLKGPIGALATNNTLVI